MRSDAISRLRTANPAVVVTEHGREPAAQAALEQILETPRAAPSAPRRAAKRRGLVFVLALLGLAVGVGGVLAATDPAGWWSGDPSQAHYRVAPNVRVRTPTAQQIRCRGTGVIGRFRCEPAQENCYQVGDQAPFCELSGVGLAYRRLDAIRAPPSNSALSRAGFANAVARALAARTMTAGQAARFRADVARVPDGFFTELRLAGPYGTYGGGEDTRDGRTRVPPRRQPATLVCTDAGRGFSCQDLNGDLGAPIGAGVYTAIPGPGWRSVASPRSVGGLPPGVRFTAAEYRVLIDLVRFGTTTHGGSGVTQGRAKPIKVIHIRAQP